MRDDFIAADAEMTSFSTMPMMNTFMAGATFYLFALG